MNNKSKLLVFVTNLTFLLSSVGMLSSCDKKITVLGEDSSNLSALEELKGDYEDSHDIRIVFRPNSFEKAGEKANMDFLHHTGLYDIVLQYNFSLSSYVRNNFVYNVDSLVQLTDNESKKTFEDDLYQNAWEEVGHYYKNPYNHQSDKIQKVGYPFATNTMILVYNQRMFDNPINKEAFKKKYNRDLDVPKTWEQYEEIAQFFTNEDTYGVCMQGAAGGWLYYEYCDFLYGMNGAIFDKKYGWEGDSDTPITINSDNALKATERYMKILRNCNKGNFLSVDATEQVKMIKEGDVAMGLVWSDYLYGFLKEPYNQIFGFAAIPGEKSPIAGGCYYVNRDTKFPHEAANYIMYLMQPEMQVKLALKGLCSPLKSTYEDTRVKSKILYADALSKSLERGTYMFEAGLEANLVSDIVTNHIQRLWKNEKLTIKEILQQIERDIESGRKDIYRREEQKSLVE